jgi:hypothetical protein
MLQRVLLATFSIRPHHATSEALSPPFPHFDPFGTEFREPGRVSYRYRNYKDHSLRRSLASTRSRDLTFQRLISAPRYLS